MAILQKKHAIKLFIELLVEIAEENYNEFPERLDVFAYKITNKLYKKFKYIEGNQLVFERGMDLEPLPVESVNIFKLINNEKY